MLFVGETVKFIMSIYIPSKINTTKHIYHNLWLYFKIVCIIFLFHNCRQVCHFLIFSRVLKRHRNPILLCQIYLSVALLVSITNDIFMLCSYILMKFTEASVCILCSPLRLFTETGCICYLTLLLFLH